MVKTHIKEESASVALVQSRLNQLQQELDLERETRVKAERRCLELEQELNIVCEQLDESGGAQAVQQCKRQEEEIIKLRRSLDDSARNQDDAMSLARLRHSQEMQVCQDEIDSLKKAKARLDSEKTEIALMYDQVVDEIDDVKRNLAVYEQKASQFEAKFNDAHLKAQAFERSSSQFESMKNKLSEENATIREQLIVLEKTCSDLTKNNKNLESDLAEQKMALKTAIKARDDFHEKYEDIKIEFGAIQTALEDEQESHSEAKRRLVDVTNNYEHYKHLYEVEAVQKIEDLEDAKRKLTMRVREIEETLTEVQGKLPVLEKLKTRLMAENAELTDDLERTQGDLNIVEKAFKKADHELHDLRNKHELVLVELQNTEKHWKETAAQLSKVKQKYEDACAELEVVKRENKKIRDDLENVKEELVAETARVKELDAGKRKIEIEYDAISAILEELEITVSEEKMTTQRSIAELNIMINEAEAKLAKKDEDAEAIRRTMQQQLNVLGENLENEIRNRSEQARQRKKFEDLSIELEAQVDRLSATNAELVRVNKKISQDLKDIEMRLDDEKLNHDNTLQNCNRAEKKLKETTKAYNDAKLDLEQAERVRKLAQTEVEELTARAELLQGKNTELTFAKQKIEKEISGLKIDQEDMEERAKLAEEKAKRILGELDKLGIDMKQLQEQATAAEISRDSSERTVRELQKYIDEMERVGVRQLRNEIRTLERKVFETEEQLGEERRNVEEFRKLFAKAEKRNRAMESILEDERKTSEILHIRNEGLNSKMKKMREAMEISETEAATLLAKYRKCQAELDDAEDRADAAHSALLMRGKTPKAGRSRAMTPAAARSRMRSRARSPEPRDYRDYESTDRLTSDY